MPPRLLLIDDEPRVARALEFAFRDTVQIESVTRPEDAVERATSSCPDAILLDIGLGSGNGLEVCSQLKATGVLKDIPVIILSGQTDADTKTAAFAAGADDFVAKPFVPTELIARIEAQLKRRAAR